MTTAQQVLDDASDESLDELTKEQWLEWLESLRDELDIRIALVKAEIE